MKGSQVVNSKRWRLIARVFGLVTAAIGAVVLVGWVLNVAALKSIFPSLVSMKANTAIGMLFCGVALALLSRRSVKGPSQYFAEATAVFAIVLGALTLSEYLVGWDLGIDQGLFRDVAGTVGTSHSGRMSPASSL